MAPDKGKSTIYKCFVCGVSHPPCFYTRNQLVKNSETLHCLWLERSIWLCPGLPSISLSDIKSLETEDYTLRHPDEFVSDVVVGPVFHKARHYSSRALNTEGNAMLSTSIFLGLLSTAEAIHAGSIDFNLAKINDAMIAFGAYPLCRHRRLGQVRLPGPLSETCPFERINLNSQWQSHTWLMGGYDILDSCPCHLKESKRKPHQPVTCGSPGCTVKITFSLYQDQEHDLRRNVKRVAIHIKRNLGPPSTLSHESPAWFNQVDEWADAKCRSPHLKPAAWKKSMEKTEQRAANKYRANLLVQWERGMQYVELKSGILERVIRLEHPEGDLPFEFLEKSRAGIGALELTLRDVIRQIMASRAPMDGCLSVQLFGDSNDGPRPYYLPNKGNGLNVSSGPRHQARRDSSQSFNLFGSLDSPFEPADSQNLVFPTSHDKARICRFSGIKGKLHQISRLFKKEYESPRMPEMRQHVTAQLLMKAPLHLHASKSKNNPRAFKPRQKPGLVLGGFE